MPANLKLQDDMTETEAQPSQLPALDVHALNLPQGPESGVNAIWGQWPGDETEEEVFAALDQLS